MTAVLVAVGLGMVLLPLWIGNESGIAWLSGVLVNGGTAVLLFVPFYALTRGLDRHIEEVRDEAASSVGQLTERVVRVEEDVDRRLGEIAASVTDRLTTEREADAAAFDSLRTAPTREGVSEALRRADELGLTSGGHPPRVDVTQGRYLYVSAAYFTEADKEMDPEVDTITFRIEDMSGDVKAWVPWREGQSTDDAMVKVGRVVQRETSETFDVTTFFNGLADLLDVAYSNPARRPAIQLCPPQWVITTQGVVTYGSQRVYAISHKKLNADPSMASHVAGKTWSDADSFDEANMAAGALFPASTDEPPF